MHAIQNRDRAADATPRRWLKHVGTAGFTFFLIKGLAWLAVPFVVAMLG